MWHHLFNSTAAKLQNLSAVLSWNRQATAIPTRQPMTQFNRSDHGEHDSGAMAGYRPCEYCMDLNKENYVGNGQPFKTIAFRRYLVADAPSITCPYCRLIVDAMRVFDLQDGSRWQLQLEHGLVLKGKDNGKNHQLEFYTTPEEERSPILPSSIAKSKHVRSIRDEPSEIDVLRHRLEKDPAEPSKLPTRVLDLGVGMRDLDDIRIFESPPGSEEALYATLSHCWGREDIKTTKTVSANIDARLVNLPLSDLPDSFRQAVFVCRRLGVRYLWIDSLCIIQDDDADWKREGADMDNVYANAWFTIAMHQSTRGEMPFQDIELRVGDQSTIVHVRRIPELLDIVQTEVIAPAVGYVHELADNKHWNKVTQRGWCFQERVLSTRMVHFTEHEYLYEERGQVRTCQCNRHFGWGLGFAGALPRWPTEQERNHNAWSTLVQQYTQRMFGYPSDLLPGFAGIAERFGGKRDLGRYVAGLWEKDLMKGLCWRSQAWASAYSSSEFCDDCRPHPRRIQWTTKAPIPSFSWASRFGPCEFVYEPWKLSSGIQVASIEHIECMMDKENPFFNIRPLNPKNWPADPCGQYLRIRGSLYECRHFSNSGLGFQFNVSMGLCQKEHAWAVPDYFVQQWDLSRDIKDILEDARKCGNNICVDAGDDLPPNNSRIYLLPLFEFEDGAMMCLILRTCSEKITGELLDTVEGEENLYWMERIGISMFNGSRFDCIDRKSVV